MTSMLSRQFLGLGLGLPNTSRSVFARSIGQRYASAMRTDIHIPKMWSSNIGVSALAKGPRKTFPYLMTAVGVTGIAFGITDTIAPLILTIHCDSVPAQLPQFPQGDPPTSSVNYYELSFGTVCGVCAGIFIKKGAKLVAFFLGGGFVLLQYLSSTSLVRVDWTRMAQRFENLFCTKDALGQPKAPTIGSVWRSIVNFLTADFQPRASFIAGLALGLRVG
ncbi:FUN14 family-domain-containing protein [Hygrophoropsis aurantiaca]|uniref:FUN14 family-domain-containing protein n=1 Tax=Hygrophoropsis aurantiaca TaxID=72124 RepID=A0ACB8APN9_9AGAM|nr:FUN14 family-domain-containing protein [Hygrophoropsis aurantiaca]